MKEALFQVVGNWRNFLNLTCFFPLRELSVGRGSTAPVGGGAFPKIHSVEPWDGKDGEVRGAPSLKELMVCWVQKLVDRVTRNWQCENSCFSETLPSCVDGGRI